MGALRAKQAECVLLCMFSLPPRRVPACEAEHSGAGWQVSGDVPRAPMRGVRRVMAEAEISDSDSEPLVFFHVFSDRLLVSLRNFGLIWGWPWSAV